jgi:hypothetical protein
MRETALVGTKGPGVVVTSTVHQPCRMLDMKHFVVKDVFNEPLRYIQ